MLVLHLAGPLFWHHYGLGNFCRVLRLRIFCIKSISLVDELTFSSQHCPCNSNLVEIRPMFNWIVLREGTVITIIIHHIKWVQSAEIISYWRIHPGFSGCYCVTFQKSQADRKNANPWKEGVFLFSFLKLVAGGAHLKQGSRWSVVAERQGSQAQPITSEWWSVLSTLTDMLPI